MIACQAQVKPAARINLAGIKDNELLRRFAERREEPAFAALLERHGPLVLSVCRRFLSDANDVDDAFQATFVILACKANTIRKQSSIASWLFGVAARVSARMKHQVSRRRACENQTLEQKTSQLPADVSWRELCVALHEEMRQLPEKQRLPLLLCYWDGQSQEEAARYLGWARGTLKRRLESGRERLRRRLSARGLTLSVALLGSMLLTRSARAAMPRCLVLKTVKLGCGAAGPVVASSAPALFSLAALATGKVPIMLGMAAAITMAAAGTLGLGFKRSDVRTAVLSPVTHVSTTASSAPVPAATDSNTLCANRSGFEHQRAGTNRRINSAGVIQV
jgi:RNA polymerase sigma factor (sigma-70 family)